MNATLKSVQTLLRSPDESMQLAAVRVLGALKTREPGVHRAFGELLITTENAELQTAILDAIDQSPHEQVIRYLLRMLEREEQDHHRVLATVARIGAKALPPLKLHFERVASATQEQIVAIYPRLRTHLAHGMLIDALTHHSSAVVRAALRALRDELPHYEPAEKSDLQALLEAALKDRGQPAQETSLSALCMAVGMVADPKAEALLLPFTRPGYPTVVRRHALLAFSRLPPAEEDQTANWVDGLSAYLDENDYEGLVKPAIVALARSGQALRDPERLREWLSNKHPGVRAFAIQALSKLDSAENAQLMLDFLYHPEPLSREAAWTAMRQMSSAVPVILKVMDQAILSGHSLGVARGLELAKLLEPHPGCLTPDRARTMVKKMLRLLEAGDLRHEWFLAALRALRPDMLASELIRQSSAAFASGDWPAVCKRLRLLDGVGLLTENARYQLVVARLKSGVKDPSRAVRQEDYALAHLSAMLAGDPKGIRARLFADPALEDADLLYVGYHFSESLNEERRFGADVLRHVAAKWPKRQSARKAKDKLLVEK